MSKQPGVGHPFTARPILRHSRAPCAAAPRAPLLDHALLSSPLLALLGFPSLSYHRAQLPLLLPAPLSLCSTTVKRVDQRTEGGRVSLCTGVCGSLPDPICPPPPPVTHQALCPRPGSKGHLHTCRAVQRERGCCASVPVPYSCLAETFTGRFLPARRCQPYFYT